MHRPNLHLRKRTQRGTYANVTSRKSAKDLNCGANSSPVPAVPRGKLDSLSLAFFLYVYLAKNMRHSTTVHTSPPAGGGGCWGWGWPLGAYEEHSTCRTILWGTIIMFVQITSWPLSARRSAIPDRGSTQHGGFAMDGSAKAVRVDQACGVGLFARAWWSFRSRALNGKHSLLLLLLDRPQRDREHLLAAPVLVAHTRTDRQISGLAVCIGTAAAAQHRRIPSATSCGSQLPYVVASAD